MSFILPDFTDCNILVVGDVMLDQYWHGSADRISPEAPVPVVKVQKTEERLGGACNVALNIQHLGASCQLLGICGRDEAAEHLERHLKASGIDFFLQKVPGTSTITKLRVISRNQQLIRLDMEDDFQHVTGKPFLDCFEQQLASAQLLLLSDYGKGTLSDPRVLIQKARERSIPVFIDPKGRDYSRYKGATLLTPNRQEFEAVFGVCRDENDLILKGQRAIAELDLQALLVTRSEEGMTLMQRDLPVQHFPTQAKEVYDVTGAGDTVIAVLAIAFSVHKNLSEASMLANIAAGIVVSRMGTTSITAPELRRALQEAEGHKHSVVTDRQLIQLVKDAKDHQEKIVMTNGCFDILHAGHITYLQQAKALGERLIVAVNDDQSVKRLKGSGRPINSLEKRMMVLAALEAVDWVVPFSEDTPANIINHVMPDVLVKGGDYEIHGIVGSDTVIKNGGEVIVLPFVEGCSTTNVINHIRQREEETAI